jgi:hypothetical protein
MVIEYDLKIKEKENVSASLNRTQTIHDAVIVGKNATGRNNFAKHVSA